ncbi:hypothetical protein EV363DRAFT_1582736 [Boletus edulis]|nr:hypothetical protein EV363DRAFT_1582736 [Boletus edulis]
MIHSLTPPRFLDMNNLVSVDTSHPIAASIFCGLTCSEPRMTVQGISTCHQWLHAGRPLPNGSEYVLWHVCRYAPLDVVCTGRSCRLSLRHCHVMFMCSCLQPDLFNTFQQQDDDELGTVVLPSLGTNSDRDWLCDSHSPPSNASPYSYSMNLDSDGVCADGHVFQYRMEDNNRSIRVGMGIARRVDPDADGLDRDVHDSDLHVHGLRGVVRTDPSGLLTSLIQRWNQDVSWCRAWANSGDDGRPSVWTGTATWSRTRAVYWDAVSPSLSIHEACHGSQVQPGQGHVDSDPDVATYCLETLSMAHGLHDMDTLGHLESERRGSLSRATSLVHVNDRQTLSALQDPHEARGVGVIVKALVQQNAGASLFLRTIVCVAALLCCAHSMLVLGERPSFIRD